MFLSYTGKSHWCSTVEGLDIEPSRYTEMVTSAHPVTSRVSKLDAHIMVSSDASESDVYVEFSSPVMWSLSDSLVSLVRGSLLQSGRGSLGRSRSFACLDLDSYRLSLVGWGGGYQPLLEREPAPYRWLPSPSGPRQFESPSSWWPEVPFRFDCSEQSPGLEPLFWEGDTFPKKKKLFFICLPT